MSVRKHKKCVECKGRGVICHQNVDGEYELEPCICTAYPREMMQE